MVLCFVEFADSKCAMTAMDTLQGKVNATFCVNFRAYLIKCGKSILYPCVLLGPYGAELITT